MLAYLMVHLVSKLTFIWVSSRVQHADEVSEPEIQISSEAPQFSYRCEYTNSLAGSKSQDWHFTPHVILEVSPQSCQNSKRSCVYYSDILRVYVFEVSM
jgi:hypothetical protein